MTRHPSREGREARLQSETGSRAAPSDAENSRSGILFLSGGDALAATATCLVRRGLPSVHLITPFDSGGSSAALREALAMPAVGDLRNRLIALSPRSPLRTPLIEAFSARLPADAVLARAELAELATAQHPVLGGLDCEVCPAALRSLWEALPEGFDARHASVGNLILAGLYLQSGRDLQLAVDRAAELLGVEDVVRPVVDANLHLRARLQSGEVLERQHLLTGKEGPPISSPVDSICLVDAEGLEVAPPIDAETRRLIAEASLICFPVGSFYSSVAVNLLPAGIAEAIARASCPKVYVPNLGCDPEQFGMSASSSVERLLALAEAVPSSSGKLLDFVLVDSSAEQSLRLDRSLVEAAGVEWIEAHFCSEARDRIEPDALVDVLLALTETARARPEREGAAG